MKRLFLALGLAMAIAPVDIWAMEREVPLPSNLKPIIQGEKPKGFAGIIGNIPEILLTLVRISHGEIAFLGNKPLPKGILLIGPTGTGKTALARALSEEILCPFIDEVAFRCTPETIPALFAQALQKAQSVKLNRPKTIDRIY